MKNLHSFTRESGQRVPHPGVLTLPSGLKLRTDGWESRLSNDFAQSSGFRRHAVILPSGLRLRTSDY